MVIIIVKLCVICNSNSNLDHKIIDQLSPQVQCNYLQQTILIVILLAIESVICSLYVCCCNIDNQYIIEEEDCS